MFKRQVAGFISVWAVLVFVGATAGAQEAPADENPLAFGNPDGVWGQFKLHYRLRPEFRQNADLNSSEDDKRLVGFQRARIGLAVNYASWLKSFVQFQDVRTLGYLNSSVAYGGNTDLHQAWVQFALADEKLTLRIGRQHLVYGDQRLIGHLEWANVPRLFDAAVLRVNYPIGWLDLFVSVFSSDLQGDLIDHVTLFFGAYNALHLLDKKVVWEQYILGLVDGNDARPPGQLFDPTDTTAASPERGIGTVGTRARYQGDALSGGLEVAYQFGQFNSEAEVKQRALALHADVKYVIPVATKPYVRVEGNYATGDDDDPSDHEGFVNLFPTNHLHYGYMDLVNWSNAVNFSLGAGFAPAAWLKVSLDYWLLARASEHAAWTNAGGKPLLTPAQAAGSSHAEDKLLGHEIDLTAKLPINKYLKVVTGFSVFLPAGYAKAKGDDPQIWTFAMLVLNF